MSNVFDKHTKRPLAEGKVTLTLDWKGHKVVVQILYCAIDRQMDRYSIHVQATY